jgi:hypothetical protein
MSWVYLTEGKPGAGKSLDQARTALRILNGYFYIEKKYPKLPRRQFWSNQKFAPRIEAKAGERIQYWNDVQQLKVCRRVACWRGSEDHPLHDVDVGWDEVGKDLPSDSWLTTPKWLRQFFSHHRKRGVRIFANTQDYKAVDINVRRMVKNAYRVKKVWGSRDISVTLPPVRIIWGVIKKTYFDPDEIEYEIDPRKRISLVWPSFFWIGRKLVETYDTSQELPPYKSHLLSHEESLCEKCGKVSVLHAHI